MTRHWRREYVDVGIATVTHTLHGFVMVFLPMGEDGGKVRIASTLTDAQAIADQMAGAAASDVGEWAPDSAWLSQNE